MRFITGNWELLLTSESYYWHMRVITGNWEWLLASESYYWHMRVITGNWELLLASESYFSHESYYWQLRVIAGIWEFFTGNWELLLATESYYWHLKVIADIWELLRATYPEWPHRQCCHSVRPLVICSLARIAVCNTWSSGGTALCKVGGATSQLDLPSLTPLSVTGCGWLQQGAPHWATSVNYCK